MPLPHDFFQYADVFSLAVRNPEQEPESFPYTILAIIVGLVEISLIVIVISKIADLLLSRFGLGKKQRMERLAQRLHLDYDSKEHEFSGEIKGFRVRLFYRFYGRGGGYVISVLSNTDIGKIFFMDRPTPAESLFSNHFTGDKDFDKMYSIGGDNRERILKILDKDIRNRLIGLRDSGYLKITPDSEYEYEGFNNKLLIEKSAPFAMEEVLTVIEAIENKVREVLH
ncbi:MAG: hypothetical protein V2I97_25070 [Desulfococcaceae bacterium]|jgi:hypothetical protein|nr:hypothetical protein [Desulfococcaceae bacterium]